MNIDKKDIIKFFDSLAPTWDGDQVDRRCVIEEILDYAEIDKGKKVLDIACGTGLLFPYYLQREVSKVTGIDISSKMIEIAITKFGNQIELINDDAMEYEFESDYDCVVVYNAYPHFPDGRELIEKLSSALKVGGRLTIAHGFSRDTINKHHSGLATRVSCELEEAMVLKDKFDNKFNVDVVVSDKDKYIVSGIKLSS